MTRAQEVQTKLDWVRRALGVLTLDPALPQPTVAGLFRRLMMQGTRA